MCDACYREARKLLKDLQNALDVYHRLSSAGFSKKQIYEASGAGDKTERLLIDTVEWIMDGIKNLRHGGGREE